MSESQDSVEGSGRMKGVTVVKPIVYGNLARPFGKKREEDGHTHQWTVYAKPYNNEDMSVYVKKVQFKLHDSYPNATRVVSKPPYEVTETGWGEFEVVIKIYFEDPNERPVTLYHVLKLFPSSGAPAPVVMGPLKTLVCEYYDEMIFQEPSLMMQQLLTSTRQITLGPYKHETDFEEKRQKTEAAITSARDKVKREIDDLRDKLKLAKETIARFRSEIEKSQAMH
ncbi:YEATS domain-containing protein 4 [Amphibalanus amphitrite]|uniref:YEATS domain-containing protein 4 n=1 Tax=Amphibalanus amphitrite TaxID=1232801 RepID=A0A6A4W1W0_AMPAM|nr:YEATS domain-containing protein 4-like [Amphibalanus amphitrite]XP_043246728.1 YEATS domain-containing protein 4-like [Amphibalanus amphitrite]XP_043246729.1 YEATS domain-containing protein 4-like [Amphibalanus amphitrite]XP_043246730.1 YEATS domain-containing protein 4-like [Amphibalanus amphitrite]XP_043246731.1 YEATS domain-containing protein 4-like [Amphibalanus amphitrite]KAF0300415.1 YEATS domain-containing protein 4 [Amphibalanus amphitrite]KAF0300416.1 YEATS domain-containing prote